MKKVFGFLFVCGMIVFASCTSATDSTEVVDETAAVVDSAATAVGDSMVVVTDTVAVK